MVIIGGTEEDLEVQGEDLYKNLMKKKIVKLTRWKSLFGRFSSSIWDR